MTNSQSRRTVDRVIRNLYFELSVYFVPESIIVNQLNLLYICSDNLSFFGVYLRNGYIAAIEHWLFYISELLLTQYIGAGGVKYFSFR